jgi:site-specific recombinase XerD
MASELQRQGANQPRRESKPSLIELYAANCQSPNTGKNAHHWLTAFAAWLEESYRVRDLSKARPEHVIAYKTHLTGRGLAASSVARCCECLRSFYRWACDQGMIDRDPAKSLKSPRAVLGKEPTYLETAEVKRLFKAINSRDRHAKRDRAMLWTLAVGLRAGEVVSLNIASVIPPSNGDLAILAVEGKRNYARQVPLSRKAYAALGAYLDTRPEAEPTEPLFTVRYCGDACKRMTIAGLEKRFRVLCERAEIDDDKQHPHACRHGAAMRWLYQSSTPGGIYTVSRLLGHSSIQTTQKYLHVGPVGRRAMAEAVLSDPLSV